MERTIDVTALGELLIDFTESGLSPQGNPLLEANPGGAPCNLLAMLARLGHRTAFLGKVGRDAFGDMLRQRVSGVGVDVSGLRVDENIPTTLAFVHTQPGGERDFSFYRKPGADLMLGEDEVDLESRPAAPPGPPWPMPRPTAVSSPSTPICARPCGTAWTGHGRRSTSACPSATC